MAESRALGDEEKALDAAGRPAGGRGARPAAAHARTFPSADCPDGAGEQDNVVLRTEGYDADAYGAAPACAALGHRHRARDPRRRAGRQDLRVDVHAVPGLGRSAPAGHGAAQPRSQRRRLRGAPSAHPRAHRHDDRHRTPPEVRGRGVPHGARRPLGDPHRRGARSPRCTATRCSTKPTCRCATPRTRRASAERRAPPVATRAGCSASTSSTRSSSSRWPAAPSRPSPARRTSSPAARRCSPSSASPYRVLDLCTGDLGASAARTWDIEAYAPGCDMWLEVSSVSWFSDYQARRANIRYRPTGGEGHRGVPHRERLGDGVVAHRRGLPRDASPARWLDRDREGPPGLPGRRGHPRPSAEPAPG